MDSIDIFLYIAYALTILAAIAAIAFPIVNSMSEPKSLIKSGIGIGGLLVIFLISWVISGNEFTAYQASEFGISASLSKFVGGMIIMMYLLIAVALGGILYTSFSKLKK